jgi:predicted transcriptional regulator
MLTEEQKSELRKIQATLTKISLNIPCFFNLVIFRDEMKLVREFGKNQNNTTKWILTEKGKRLLSVML